MAADGAPGHECLQLPRPWRLALTAGWSLAESLGLPLAGYAIAAALSGPAAGMLTATVVVWLTAAVRKIATGTIPGLVVISALTLTLQTALVIVTGSELLFLLQFPLANLGLCALFARTARSSRPLVAELAAEVVAFRQPASGHRGIDAFFQRATWLWAGIFAASAAGLAALVPIEPASVFLALTTAVTLGGAIFGAFICTLWFAWVVRRSGLRLTFSQA